MSLLLHGPEENIQRLSKYLRYYSHLADTNGVLPDHAEDFSFDTSAALLIENKYYSADLQMQLHPLPSTGTTSPLVVDRFEGIVLVPANNQANLEDEVYSLARNAADADIPLRLLITMKNDKSEDSLQQYETYMMWAIDHGFELIEIFESNLMEDMDSRDKTGLPRLLEALQSTMWSTMKKKKLDATKTTKPAATEEPKVNMHKVKTEPSKEEVPEVKKEVPSSKAKIVPDEPTSNSNKRDLRSEIKDSGIPIEDDDHELDGMDVFEKAIDQARQLRDAVATGTMNDDERRSRAAAMAMKLMEMMNLDDDSEDESS